MPTFVALLRGVNVGKANRVPMADFRALLANLGYTGVATLLNSGNAVFRSARGAPAKHATDIAAALAHEMQVEVQVVVKSAKEIAAIVSECPIKPEAPDYSRFVVAFVQDSTTLRGLAAIDSLTVRPERFAIGRQAAYLHCAAGILQSEAGKALLGKGARLATTRNWATVLKLAALANGDA